MSLSIFFTRILRPFVTQGKICQTRKVEKCEEQTMSR
jgi:hypothetical protein